jgi:hypothetical protein
MRLSRLNYLGAAILLAGCATQIASKAERDAHYGELQTKITATEPHCSTPDSCNRLFAAAKEWALNNPQRSSYYANSTRITMMMTNQFALDIRMTKDANGYVMRAEKTCIEWIPCFNQAAATILEFNVEMAKAVP